MPGEVRVEQAEPTWALAGQSLRSPVELYSLAGADLSSSTPLGDTSALSYRPLRTWSCRPLPATPLLPAEACLCSWWVATLLKMASISGC